jgi:hypothetical protein
VEGSEKGRARRRYQMLHDVMPWIKNEHVSVRLCIRLSLDSSGIEGCPELKMLKLR